jgi:hypothetical protein
MKNKSSLFLIYYRCPNMVVKEAEDDDLGDEDDNDTKINVRFQGLFFLSRIISKVMVKITLHLLCILEQFKSINHKCYKIPIMQLDF